VNTFVDTAFVGQLGNNELAAFSVNSSIFTFAFLVFNFLSTATTPAVATALAMGDQKKVGLAYCWRFSCNFGTIQAFSSE
jgi:Na+-driven multidrug efflux pump